MNNKFVQQWSISVYDCEKLCIYRNIKVEFCHEKNVVENEYHFVLVCPAYRSVRTHFCQHITVLGRIFINLNTY